MHGASKIIDMFGTYHILKAVKTLKEAGPDEEIPWLDLQSRWCMRHLGANFFS
jgi:hypothetical protein